jgi:hypothetical protein
VVHLRGNAGHSTNSTQQDYINDFFSDCEVPLGVNEIIIDGKKITRAVTLVILYN